LIYHNWLFCKSQITELLIKWLIFFKWYTLRQFCVILQIPLPLFNIVLFEWLLNRKLWKISTFKRLLDAFEMFLKYFSSHFSCHILSFLRTLDQKARPINTLIWFDQVKTCLISIQEIWSKIFRTIARILNCILSDQLRF